MQIFLSYLASFLVIMVNFRSTFHFRFTSSVTMNLKKKLSEPEPTLAALKWYVIEFKTSNSSARRVASARQTQSSEKCFAKLQEMGRLTTSVSLLSSIQLYLLFCRGSETVVANDAECIRFIYLRLLYENLRLLYEHTLVQNRSKEVARRVNRNVSIAETENVVNILYDQFVVLRSIDIY